MTYPKKDTICLDFDGVIHSYHSGWTGPIPTDPPVPGAKEAIARLRERFKVVIYTCRTATGGGREGIENWLKKHEIVVDAISTSVREASR